MRRQGSADEGLFYYVQISGSEIEGKHLVLLRGILGSLRSVERELPLLSKVTVRDSNRVLLPEGSSMSLPAEYFPSPCWDLCAAAVATCAKCFVLPGPFQIKNLV